MEIRITRRKMILSTGNSWSDYINYWLIHGRIYSDDGRYYKAFKFVALVNFSVDGWDEEEQRDRTEKEMLDDLEFCFLDVIRSFDDCGEFFDLCNQSIRQYNEGLRHNPLVSFANITG